MFVFSGCLAFLFLFTSVTFASLYDGLIACYRFDGDTNDYSKYQHHGEGYNIGISEDRFDRPNSAANFNGTDSYIKTLIDINPTAIPEMSFCAWVFPTYVPTSNTIMSHDDADYDRSLVIVDYNWVFYVGGKPIYTHWPVEENEWAHVALIYKQDVVIFYLNGIPYLYEDSSYSSSRFTLHIGNNPGFNKHFHGKIDDVYIYNRPLSESEVLSIKDNDLDIPIQLYNYIGDEIQISNTTNYAQDIKGLLYTDMPGILPVDLTPISIDLNHIQIHIPSNENLSPGEYHLKLYNQEGSSDIKGMIQLIKHPVISNKEQTYNSLNSAVSEAIPGDTLIISDGTLVENVVINKALTICSEHGYSHTTIIAEDSNQHIFEIIENNVTLSGFGIFGAVHSDKAGIFLNASNCSILNNCCGLAEWQQNYDGIKLNKGMSETTIVGNICQYNINDGIFFSANDSLLQNNSVISNGRYGLHLFAFQRSLVYKNLSALNIDCGIFIDAIDDNTIMGNTCQQNKSHAIEILYALNNTIYYNHIASNENNENDVINSHPQPIDIWHSSCPFYYEYKDQSFKNTIGNFYGDHVIQDDDNDGISNNYYPFPEYEKMADFPLSSPISQYRIHTMWIHDNGRMYDNDMLFSNKIISMTPGMTKLWIADQAEKTDSQFFDANVWTGQLTFKTKPPENSEFLIAIGYSSGSNFQSAGIAKRFVSKGDSYIIPFCISGKSFVLPKDTYLSLKISNYSNSTVQLKTGNMNTFISKPSPQTEPIIFSVSPDQGPTSGGTTVTITGSDFGDDQLQNQVLFGGLAASEYIEWENTQIICVTPEHVAERVDIKKKMKNEKWGRILIKMGSHLNY